MVLALQSLHQLPSWNPYGAKRSDTAQQNVVKNGLRALARSGIYYEFKTLQRTLLKKMSLLERSSGHSNLPTSV